MFPKPSVHMKSIKKILGKEHHFRTHSGELFNAKCSLKKKKKTSKQHKRSISTFGNSLVPLEGKSVIRAPKIYSNQVFVDVYDEKGNHDRIMEISADNDRDFESQQQFVSPELLRLPSVGRNMYSTKKILFY